MLVRPYTASSTAHDVQESSSPSCMFFSKSQKTQRTQNLKELIHKERPSIILRSPYVLFPNQTIPHTPASIPKNNFNSHPTWGSDQCLTKGSNKRQNLCI